MNDRDCVRFLQETLPRLHLRWRGFRRVRRQVCRRLQRRLTQLQLADLAAYRQHLERHPAEWDALDDCCRITISRFYRDRHIYRLLERDVLPLLAAQARQHGKPDLRIWSAGCGGGEEPYSLSILRAHSPQPALRQTGLQILATDNDPGVLQRARTACYPFSSVRDLPADWRRAAFSHSEGEYCLREPYRQAVRFLQHDIRSAAPDGPFDVVLCRNLAFTYFDDGLQRETARRIATALRSGGLLVLGTHEHLPAGMEDFAPWQTGTPLYRRT
jgi:chemotaxis protein methyltransferase CheR